MMLAIFHSFQWQLKASVSVLAGVDPNEDNLVSAGIINTRTTPVTRTKKGVKGS